MAVVLSFALMLSMAQANDSGSRKIVVFKGAPNETVKNEAINQAGGTKLKDLDLIGAQAVWLPSKAAAEKLKNNPSVLRVDEDIEVLALDLQDSKAANAEKSSVTQSSQFLPWGIIQINAPLVWPNTADPILVGIIDTGISNTHPDLFANIKGGVNIINSRKSWDDDNGHGSHVAGIVAALNNTIGVVGAAPAADLYAIKVLNAAGSGSLSDVIAGIQWAVAQKIQVVNMSLGASTDVQSFHDAVIAAKKLGVVVVAAAGNSGGAVSYPGAYPEAISISATDQTNQIASWSSRGPEVDLAAPGVNIPSTYKSTGYATLSGTSMAAPHVTGTVALVLNTPVGSYDLNLNNKWDPDEVQTKLQNTAKDLGVLGRDNLYGFGLVQANAAVK